MHINITYSKSYKINEQFHDVKLSKKNKSNPGKPIDNNYNYITATTELEKHIEFFQSMQSM